MLTATVRPMAAQDEDALVGGARRPGGIGRKIGEKAVDIGAEARRVAGPGMGRGQRVIGPPCGSSRSPSHIAFCRYSAPSLACPSRARGQSSRCAPNPATRKRAARARSALRQLTGPPSAVGACSGGAYPVDGPFLQLAVPCMDNMSAADADPDLASHRVLCARRPGAVRRRYRHSTTSVEAELWITDQYFGAAKKRDSAIDARG